MMVLAILEHWFLVLPISALRVWNRMWQWSLSWRGPRVGESSRSTRKLPGPLPREATIGGGT